MNLRKLDNMVMRTDCTQEISPDYVDELKTNTVQNPFGNCKLGSLEVPMTSQLPAENEVASQGGVTNQFFLSISPDRDPNNCVLNVPI